VRSRVWTHTGRALETRCGGAPHTYLHPHSPVSLPPLLPSSPAVYSRIKDTLDKEQWKAETGEEFEDSMGTVLNRKTYEDLARQGLL
jgi:splicing factor 3A subunit 3